MRRISYLTVITLTFAVTVTFARPANAQRVPAAPYSIDELARRLDETQRQLEQTQQELDALRQRDLGRQEWERSIMRRLPAIDATITGVSEGCDASKVCDSVCDECEPPKCPGLPSFCGCCLEELNWNKANGWRIVPYGVLRGEAIYSRVATTADWGIIFLNPRDLGENVDQFTVHGKTSMLNFAFEGPRIGNWNTGGNILMNFVGGTPLRNLSGPNLLNAYGEVYNETWRFAFGRMLDLFGPIYPETVNMVQQRGAGNIGIYRGAIHVDRFFNPNGNSQWTVSARISQQDISDYLSVPQVRGTDNGWPNIEGRIGVAFGADCGQGRPFEFGVSGFVGETRSVITEVFDDLIPVTGTDVANAGGVCLDAQIKGQRIGCRGEVWAGQAGGTYFMATLQSLNPMTFQAIRSVGGWGEVYLKPWDHVTFNLGYGVDDPRNQDLGFVNPAMGVGQIASNEVAWGNIKYNLTDFFELAFEISYRETQYLVPIADNHAMLYHFSSSLTF